jgi:Mg2+ and Co2+ transporter CorA
MQMPLALAGTGYGLIGILVIILLVVLIFYFIRRA